MRVWHVKLFAPDEDGLCQVDLRTATKTRTFRVILPPDVIAEFRSGALRGAVRGDLAEHDNISILDAAADMEAAATFGQRLLDTLLTDPGLAKNYAEDLIEDLLGERHEKESVRLRLDLTEAGELAELPWELMYSDHEKAKQFLATLEDFDLWRYRAPLAYRAPEAVAPPLKLLIVVADPSGKLDTAREVRNIHGALGMAQGLPIEIDELQGATRRTLADRVFRTRPHAVHFIGHGSFVDGTGRLHLHMASDPSETDYVDSGGLRSIFQNNRPWMVFLNACEGAVDGTGARFGGLAQELLGLGIPFVVAMRRAITDDAAVDFASSFYSDFATLPLPEAVARARNLLLAADSKTLEFTTPAFYTSIDSDEEDADRIKIVTPPLPVPPGPPPPATSSRNTIRPLVVTGVLAAGAMLVGIYAGMNLLGDMRPHSAPMPSPKSPNVTVKPSPPPGEESSGTDAGLGSDYDPGDEVNIDWASGGDLSSGDWDDAEAYPEPPLPPPAPPSPPPPPPEPPWLPGQCANYGVSVVFPLAPIPEPPGGLGEFDGVPEALRLCDPGRIVVTGWAEAASASAAAQAWAHVSVRVTALAIAGRGVPAEQIDEIAIGQRVELIDLTARVRGYATVRIQHPVDPRALPETALLRPGARPREAWSGTPVDLSPAWMRAAASFPGLGVQLRRWNFAAAGDAGGEAWRGAQEAVRQSFDTGGEADRLTIFDAAPEEAMANGLRPPLIEIRFTLPGRNMITWPLGAARLEAAQRRQLQTFTESLPNDATATVQPGWRILIEGHSRRGDTPYAAMIDGLIAASEVEIALHQEGIAPERIAVLSCGRERAAIIPDDAERSVELSLLPEGIAPPVRACGWNKAATFSPKGEAGEPNEPPVDDGQEADSYP